MESDFTLRDLHEVMISEELSPEERKQEFLRQTGSSQVHKVGNVTVECVYGSMSIEKMLSDLINK